MLLALLLTTLIAGGLTAQDAPPSRVGRADLPEEDPDFQRMLSELADRADLYRRNARGFTCRETVIEAKYNLNTSDYKKSTRTTYDYLLEEAPGGEITEFRERLEPTKNGEFKRKKADFEPPVPPAYHWAALFSRENRGRFHFRPAGQVVRAYRLLNLVDFIGTAPNPGGTQISGWSGQVAVDAKTLNLWSLTAEPSGQHYRLEVEVLKYRKAFAIAGVPLASRPHGWRLDLTFGLERYGLSFPTEQALSMTSLAADQVSMNVEEKTTFKYEDYLFFDVDAPPGSVTGTEGEGAGPGQRP